MADDEVDLARLSHAAFERLAADDPALRLRLTQSVDVLLRDRSVRRRAIVTATARGLPRPVPTGHAAPRAVAPRARRRDRLGGPIDARPTSLTAGDFADALDEEMLAVVDADLPLQVTAHPAFPTAFRLLGRLDRFVTIDPDHVPPTSILRERIGNRGFEG